MNDILKIKKKYKYPLLDKGLSREDLMSGIKVLKTGFITMNKNTEKFENNFKKKFNSKYALMVNSGSSANLLSVFAACNPLRKNRFKRGDHALISSVCWSTSLWPLVQSGLKPIFLDANPKTLNVDADYLISKVTKKTKVIMIVNVLGGSDNLEKISKFAKKKNIILIEDNCEALGAKYNNKYLGTFGDFGTFSFFYSHQMTCGEGGMILCKNRRDYEILHSLRSHGWSRGKMMYKYYAKKYPKLDPRYIFINSGFNLRPTDIQAAIGISQLKRVDSFKKIRSQNKIKIINSLKKDKRWSDQFTFIDHIENVEPSYMVLPFLLNKKYIHKKKAFLNRVETIGLETRPIISGSFINQPSAKLYKLDKFNFSLIGSQTIQDLGFVIGLHTHKINKSLLNFVKNTLFSIDKI